jgi:hypothetical protein
MIASQDRGRESTPPEHSGARPRRSRPFEPPVPIPCPAWTTRTCASLLFEAGKDVKQVQEWLGHADPGFTLRTYVHLMDDGLGDADFLDRAVALAQ